MDRQPSFTIKNYQQRFCHDLLEVWNDTLPYDLVSQDRFMNQVVLDENFDPALALTAFDGEKLIGTCLGICNVIDNGENHSQCHGIPGNNRENTSRTQEGAEPVRGFITALFVAKEYQRKGLGTRLLEECEKRMRSRGVQEIILASYRSHYFTPGVDIQYAPAVSFFESHGYECQGQSVSMARSLLTYSMSDEWKARRRQFERSGIFFQLYEERFLDALLDLTSEQFGSEWTANVLDLVRRKEAEDTIVLARQDDNVLGFCMRAMNGSAARFGPVGVRAECRGRGIGSMLLEVQMMEMRKQAISSFYCLWTGGDAARLYLRHGLKVYRTYNMYHKELDV